MKDCPGIPFIGLSATPWARGLGKYYDDLIIAATTADLIRDGYLSPFVAFAPSEPDLANVRTVAGDFHEGRACRGDGWAVVTGDIVETWLKRGEGRSTLLLLRQSPSCAARRRAIPRGGRRGRVHGRHRPRAKTGRRIFDRFRSGETRSHLQRRRAHDRRRPATCRCIIDAKPTKSRILFVQTIGRGLRTAEGKDHLLILDHAGNHLRLGMVTDIGQDHLDDGKERQSAGSARP